VIFFIYYFWFRDILTLENLKLYREDIKQIVAQNYILSVGLYLLMLVFTSFSNVPITVIQTIAAGFLFGPIIGVIYANIGATLGSLSSFLFFRYFLGHLVQKKYADQLKNFNKQMKKHGASYMLTLHFLPFTPTFFDSLAGLSKPEIIYKKDHRKENKHYENSFF